MTRVPVSGEVAIFSMRSAYRSVFLACALLQLVSKHTVSSKIQTSLVWLLHTMMSGRSSVAVILYRREDVGLESWEVCQEVVLRW